MATTSPFYITVPELGLLEARFAGAPETVKVALRKALEKAAIATQSIVMMNVPVRTGRLRQSVRYEVAKSQAVVFIDPKLKYAGYVEAGTGLFGEHGSLIEPVYQKVMATKVNPGWGTANKQGYFIIGTYTRGQEANKFMERSHRMAIPIVKLTFAEATRLIVKQMAAA